MANSGNNNIFREEFPNPEVKGARIQVGLGSLPMVVDGGR